ncbi:hypothetical protein GCM10023192_06240 [Amycolatopsis samaneae]
MRVSIVEDEPYLAEAIRDGLRRETITADITGDGDSAAYNIAALDRDLPGPSGDGLAERGVAYGGGVPILVRTAADRHEAHVVHNAIAHNPPEKGNSASQHGHPPRHRATGRPEPAVR